MGYGITNTQHYGDIANAIRAKRPDLPADVSFSPSDMADAIQGIREEIISAPLKTVNYIDYDGTVLHSYTAGEFSALDAHPTGPTHDRLTFDGWNWSLADAKAQLTAQPEDGLTIGALYLPSENEYQSEIDIALVDPARLSPYLSLAVNGTVSIDWGDGSDAETMTGSSLSTRISKQHTYPATGNYMIRILVPTAEDSYAFYGTSVYPLLNNDASSSFANNTIYSSAVQAIRVGKCAEIGNYAFAYLYQARYITLHKDAEISGTYSFYSCYSLSTITVPGTSVGGNVFQNCYGLETVSLPAGMTSIEKSTFASCYSLKKVVIPSGVTVLKNAAFSSCYSLAGITIPAGVTSIEQSVFSNCYGMGAYRVQPTTPPTLGSSMVFNGIPNDCVIYVPSAQLATYQSASIWSTWASYMQGV